MLQVPNLSNVQQPPMACPMPSSPSYNAVKIDVHNPMVNGGQQMPVMPQQSYPAYAPVTNPYYQYPQAPIYDYPQAQQPMPQMQQPMAQVQQPMMQQPMAQVQQPMMQQPMAQPYQQPMACPPCPPCVPQPQQVNMNAPQDAPAPEMTAPAQAPVNVAEPQAQPQPSVDLNAFLARLTNADYETQASAMEDIANMVKENPQAATELLDTKIIDSLVNLMNVDSSKLQGPTEEQIAARQKLMEGKQISEDEKALANNITAMEQAERNKSYAMYTAAILQKLYAGEVNKLTGTTVPLNELPAAMNIVEQLKDNPNPLVRTSAIEALTYIQAPEYKKDLTTLFEVAKNDVDAGVQEAAKGALNSLNQI